MTSRGATSWPIKYLPHQAMACRFQGLGRNCPVAVVAAISKSLAHALDYEDLLSFTSNFKLIANTGAILHTKHLVQAAHSLSG